MGSRWQPLRVFSLCFGLLGVLLWLGAAPVLGGGKKITSANKVKEQFTASQISPQGLQAINVFLTVEPDWYLYANPVSTAGSLLKNKTTVTARDAQIVKIDYPAGQEYDPMIGEGKIRIYEGTVMIPLVVQRPRGASGPIQLVIQVNSCGKKSMVCYPQGEITLTVP